MQNTTRLPPGQRQVEGFPRFGSHLSRPVPDIPADPVIRIRGAVTEEFVAENLDGRPLDGDHGAPVRLVSPRQYGYFSVKHLSRIGVLTAAPKRAESPLLQVHPRGRVWEEERHGLLPGRVVRPVYRALMGPIKFFSSRGAGRSGNQ